VTRTRARVAEAGRRWDQAVLFYLALLAWTVGLSSWAVWVAVFGLTGTLPYLAVSTILVWLGFTAGLFTLFAAVGKPGEPPFWFRV
jgi:hypothetical protein